MVRLFRGISKFVDLLLEISESYTSRNYTKICFISWEFQEQWIFLDVTYGFFLNSLEFHPFSNSCVEIKNSTVTLFNQLLSTNQAPSQAEIAKI